MMAIPHQLQISWLELPLARWDDAARKLKEEERRELEETMRQLAVYSARLATYLDYVSRGQGHPTAVRAQNLAAKKVRRALGFSYPKDDITF